jgi:leader peptidase (prepilin peptidase)/N-methyltransferase
VSPVGAAATALLAAGAIATSLAMPRVVAAFDPYDGEPARVPVPSRPGCAAVTVVAVLAVVAALWGHPGWLPAYLYLTVLGVVLATIDLRTHRLPDDLVLPSYPVLAALLVLATVVDGTRHRLLVAVVAGALLWLAFGVIHLIPRSGLGRGDVKLVGLLGGALGWFGPESVLFGLLAGITIAGCWAGFLLVSGRAHGQDQMAYGPHLLLGALLAVLVAG